MNEKTIRENIRRLLFEDNWVSYPTDDKAAGKFAIDADAVSYTHLTLPTNA